MCENCGIPFAGNPNAEAPRDVYGEALDTIAKANTAPLPLFYDDPSNAPAPAREVAVRIKTRRLGLLSRDTLVVQAVLDERPAIFLAIENVRGVHLSVKQADRLIDALTGALYTVEIEKARRGS